VRAPESRWISAMPVLFVGLWSTGFVTARLGMPHAPPIAFLVMRFGLSAAGFAIWVWLAGAAWPSGIRQWLHLGVLGLTTQAAYLICGWAAIKHGMGVGTMTLLVGLQPLLTAMWMNRQDSQAIARLGGRQWAGLLLGFLGLLLVVSHKLGQGELGPLNLGLGVAALLAISFGSIYQKRYVKGTDARTAMLIQLLVAFLVSAPLALLETESIVWHSDLFIALGWSVLGLTIGASSLLFVLLQRGVATQVTSLMYLIPPCAALLAWALFDEPIGMLVWLGMALSALGVFWVIKRV